MRKIAVASVALALAATAAGGYAPTSVGYGLPWKS